MSKSKKNTSQTSELKNNDINNTNISDIVKKLEKEFGERVIFTLEDGSIDIQTISSGSLLLDRALGGGYPKGRIIEIFGPESTGKTTLSLIAAAGLQKRGQHVAFIDVEHALDPNFAKNIGVNIGELVISQPDSGEQALEILSELVKSNFFGLIILDSVAALVPEVELNGDMSEQTIGAQARLMSKALRKLSGIIAKTSTTVIFINQIRSKVAVMFGNPEVTSGGRALKFFSSIRLDVRRGDRVLDNNGELIGYQSKIKIVKNKIAPPFKTAIIEVIFKYGISRTVEILKLAVEKEIISKNGIWYYYGDIKLGQGQINTVKYLDSQIKILNEIEKKLN